ncbi:hypothetical protein GBAR_LOCUS27626 [Geodia barretti]|uniref:Uncharacterized protein n=1 Tax=Geodia barretti TaxID=519541 RepID=A0AA35TNK3_GEOBA|nr:hypothetical protein GBAR_LOCUS27626 [Geodia barretti]
MPVCIVVLEVTSVCIHRSFHFPELQLLQMIHSLELAELLLAPRAKYHLCIVSLMSLDEAVKKITENHVYIAVVTSDSSIQVHLTAERCLFGKAKSPINAIS